MSSWSTQPATKWFGPSMPFAPLPLTSRVHIQLHNIQPGQFWNPAKEADLLTPIVCSPIPAVPQWLGVSTFFSFRFHYRQWRLIGGIRVPDHRIELTVREGAGIFPIAFRFDPDFAITEWMVNNITDPIGAYGINGTATLAFQGYP